MKLGYKTVLNDKMKRNGLIWTVLSPDISVSKVPRYGLDDKVWTPSALQPTGVKADEKWLKCKANYSPTSTGGN